MSGNKERFKELSDSQYTTFRKQLLRTKGGLHQVKFLKAVRDSGTFLDLMSKIPTEGEISAKLVSHPLTENEYKDPPLCTEEFLYIEWCSLKPSITCRSTFWANLTIEHIHAGLIQSSYLAANGGNLPGGITRIDRALSDKFGSPKQIDDCVRTVLRRLGGLRDVRGNRSVYVDCPFARAWWREHFADQTAGGDPHILCNVRSVLRTNQTYWEKLIDRIVYRNSTFGSENIRSAFLRVLANFVQINPSTELLSSLGMQRLCRRVTVVQGSRELSILNGSELKELMEAVVVEI